MRSVTERVVVECGKYVEWVVRAGEAQVSSLIKGYARHRGVSGALYGFSVQYAPGLGKTVEELAQAGQFPNGQISYALDGDLAAALAPLGYQIRLVASPGQGSHHTFAVLLDATGVMFQKLPQDAAIALSQTFRRRTNPYQVRTP